MKFNKDVMISSLMDMPSIDKMQSKAQEMIDEAHTSPDGKTNLIGDDLTEDELIELWQYFHGEENSMSRWWRDKPHQIAWRLLMRLVRAETALREEVEYV